MPFGKRMKQKKRRLNVLLWLTSVALCSKRFENNIFITSNAPIYRHRHRHVYICAFNERSNMCDYEHNEMIKDERNYRKKDGAVDVIVERGGGDDEDTQIRWNEKSSSEEHILLSLK